MTIEIMCAEMEFTFGRNVSNFILAETYNNWCDLMAVNTLSVPIHFVLNDVHTFKIDSSFYAYMQHVCFAFFWIFVRIFFPNEFLIWA